MGEGHKDGPADALATVSTAAVQLLDIVSGSGRIDPGVLRKVVLMLLERIHGIFSWRDKELEECRALNLGQRFASTGISLQNLQVARQTLGI